MSDIDLNRLFPELAGKLGADVSDEPTSIPGDDEAARRDYFARRLGRDPIGTGGSGVPPSGGVEDEGGRPTQVPRDTGEPSPDQVVDEQPDDEGPDDETESDDTEDRPDHEVVDEEDEREEEGGASAEPPSPPSDSFTVNGRTIPREQVESYLALDDLLSRNPQLAQRIGALINGQDSGVQGGPSESGAGGVEHGNRGADAPPPDLDLDDPTVRYLYDQNRGLRERLDQVATGVNQTNQVAMQQIQAQQQAIVNRATELFTERHGLNNDEARRIAETAANLNIISSLASPVDPITRRPRQVDLLKVVDQALETAMYAIPEFRNRAYERQRVDAASKAKRRQKAASLAGSSGSVPRQERREPRTESERRAAAIAELREHMEGTGA